jgi:hypothetical protein
MDKIMTAEIHSPKTRKSISEMGISLNNKKMIKKDAI